jgi:hypothetical protein
VPCIQGVKLQRALAKLLPIIIVYCLDVLVLPFSFHPWLFVSIYSIKSSILSLPDLSIHSAGPPPLLRLLLALSLRPAFSLPFLKLDHQHHGVLFRCPGLYWRL